MNRRWIMPGLVAVIVLQISVLTIEYIASVYPLWTGKEVRLKTTPVDPRSLFRGNYAVLNYDISRVSLDNMEDALLRRSGEIIYVKLKPAENNLHVFDGASFSKPDSGLYIRGRIKSGGWSKNSQPYPVRYGIEAFFAPKEKALDLEKRLRDGGVAVVMLANSGKAALKDVIAE